MLYPYDKMLLRNKKRVYIKNIHKSQVQIHIKTYMNLKCFMLNGGNQPQKKSPDSVYMNAQNRLKETGQWLDEQEEHKNQAVMSFL